MSEITSVSIESFEIAVSGKTAEYLAKYETTGDGKLNESDFWGTPEHSRAFAVANTYLKAVQLAGFAFSGWSDTYLLFTALFKKNVDMFYNELKKEAKGMESDLLFQFKAGAINYAFKVWFSNLQSKPIFKQPLPWGLGYISLPKDVTPEFNLAIFDLMQKGAYIYYHTDGITYKLGK